MAILTVTKAGGTVVYLPDPQEMSVGVYDVDADGSGRDQSGTMFRDRVAVKQKVECKFPPLSWSEVSTILNAIEDQFFTLTYPDPKQGSNRSMTCYVGDRTAPVLRAVSGDYLWGNLAVNFIER